MTRADAPSGPVLLVDEGFVGSLHTAMGLARSGVRVVLLGAVGGRPRAIRRPFPAVTGPRPGDPAFRGYAERTARRFSCTALYPCTEPAMEACSGLTPAPWPPVNDAQRRILADKPATSAWAESLGVPGPRSGQVRDRDDLWAAMARLGSPLILKAGRGRGGDGVHVVRERTQGNRLVHIMLRGGQKLVAQELVPGPTYLVGGLFDEGAPLRLYTGIKLKQQPARTGPASLIRSVHEPKLLERALRLFAALRWTGLASMDFIRDPTRGFLFLEINPRPWGSIAAAADAGVDLFGPLARLLAGRPVTPRRGWRAGIATRVLPLYLLDRRTRRDPRLPIQLVADLVGVQGAPFRRPELAAHTLHRLRRVRANWPRLQ